LLLGSILSSSAVAQQKAFPSIAYRLSMSHPVSHLFKVSIEVELPNDFSGESLAFQCRNVAWALRRVRLCKNVQEVPSVVGNLSAEGSVQNGAAHCDAG
jgi:hypothetical protein